MAAGEIDDRAHSGAVPDRSQGLDRLVLHVRVTVVPGDGDQRRRRPRVALVVELLHGFAPRLGIVDRPGEGDQRVGSGRKRIMAQRLGGLLPHVFVGVSPRRSSEFVDRRRGRTVRAVRGRTTTWIAVVAAVAAGAAWMAVVRRPG